MLRLLLVFSFLGIMCSASGQTWEVGGFAGGSGYMGDINLVRPYKLTDLAFGGLLKRNFDGYWSARLNIMHGTIQADDSKFSNQYQQQRNLSFYSPITELSIQTEFNFFNYLPGASPGFGNRRLSPYLFTGIGGVAFNPKTRYNGNEYILQQYGTEGQNSYKTYALCISYGAGIKYNLKGSLNIIGEVGYRTALTDYLDDVSGRYPDKNKLVNTDAAALSDRSGEKNSIYIGIPDTQRGDFRKKDTYMFVGIGLTFTFVSQKCVL